MHDYAGIWQAADKIVCSRTLRTVTSARTRIERAFDVDEWHVIVSPVVVGAGTRSLPTDIRLRLELLDERRFGNGVVHLHYRTGA